MMYGKPEVAVLGNAAQMIQGTKIESSDSGSLDAELVQAESELD